MDQRRKLLLLPLHSGASGAGSRDPAATAISAKSSRIYHVSHERNVFPELGIPSDEKVVAHALPKIEVGLKVAERELAHGKEYLLGSELSLADFYLLPSTYSFSFAPEAKAMYPKYPAFCRWRDRMEALPTVKKLRAALPPRAPIEHAREWAISHRPKY
jgi:glutathione S-transferase